MEVNRVELDQGPFRFITMHSSSLELAVVMLTATVMVECTNSNSQLEYHYSGLAEFFEDFCKDLHYRLPVFLGKSVSGIQCK